MEVLAIYQIAWWENSSKTSSKVNNSQILMVKAIMRHQKFSRLKLVSIYYIIVSIYYIAYANMNVG